MVATGNAFGSRRAGVGGRTSREGSALTVPSASRNRCQPRAATTARAADDGASGGSVGGARPQVDQEVRDVLRGDLGDRRPAGQGQELQVALQIPAIGQQGVAGDAALDGEVVEVPAERGGELGRRFACGVIAQPCGLSGGRPCTD